MPAMKEFNPKLQNQCYVDKVNRLAIGYDIHQWIVKIGGNHWYYGTAEFMLERLFDQKIKDFTGDDLMNLREAVLQAKEYVKEIGRQIAKPKTK